MKKQIITTLFALSFALAASAADKEKHDHEQAKAGPTGGKLITEVEPHVEFLINADKKVEIRFVDEANKVVTPGSQVISVVLGDRRSPTKLSFVREGDKLVSDKVVPEGNNHPTVVQIREKEGARAVTEKFNLNLDECPTCEHKEYACICAHDHEKK